MKKAVIGIMAMAGFLCAGQQASASSFDLSQAMFEAPVGPISFKYSGYSQTINGVTSGIFELTNFYYREDPSGSSQWSIDIADTSSSGTYGYAVISDFVDDQSYFTSTGMIGSTGGTWALYETNSLVDLAIIGNNPDSITNSGTLLLSGDFAVQDAAGHTLTQTFDSTGGIHGSGSAYGNITGGLNASLVEKYDANMRLFGSDLSFSFFYDTYVPNIWKVGTNDSPQNIGVRTTDPVRGNAVPEPATLLLFGTGLVGLAGIRRKRSK